MVKSEIQITRRHFCVCLMRSAWHISLLFSALVNITESHHCHLYHRIIVSSEQYDMAQPWLRFLVCYDLKQTQQLLRGLWKWFLHDVQKDHTGQTAQFHPSSINVDSCKSCSVYFGCQLLFLNIWRLTVTSCNIKCVSSSFSLAVRKEILTADTAGKSIKVVEAHRAPSETLQSAQRCQGIHGSTGTGPCCWTGC